MAHHGPSAFAYLTEPSCGVFFTPGVFFRAHPTLVDNLRCLSWTASWLVGLWFLKPMRVAWIRVFFQNGPPIENEHMWTPSWSTPVFHPWMGFLSEALLEPSKAPEAILRKISISLRRGLQSCRHPKTTLHDEFEDLRAPCLRHAENSTRFLLENFLGDS